MKNRHETNTSNVISVKRLKLQQKVGGCFFPSRSQLAASKSLRPTLIFPPTLTRPVNCPQNHCKLPHGEYPSELYRLRERRGRKPS